MWVRRGRGEGGREQGWVGGRFGRVRGSLILRSFLMLGLRGRKIGREWIKRVHLSGGHIWKVLSSKIYMSNNWFNNVKYKQQKSADTTKNPTNNAPSPLTSPVQKKPQYFPSLLDLQPSTTPHRPIDHQQSPKTNIYSFNHLYRHTQKNKKTM